MKKLGKIFVFIMLATFVAGSAMAVELAENDVGDLLFFPTFAADGTGWETNLKIINTKTDESVVAKVVIRGGETSTELLDFFIYLSPTDVWTGKIYNDNGQVKLYSDDDSMRAGGTVTNPVWADEQPVDVDIAVQSDFAACDTAFYGYIEVFEAWNSKATTTTLSLSSPPVDKDDILAEFDPLTATNNFDTQENAGAIANALAGFYEIRLPALGLSAAENAIALRDYDVNAKLELGVQTLLGQAANTTVAEVEMVLAKAFVYMPYYNNALNTSAHLFTFPTKKLNWTSCTDTTVSPLGPFFKQLPPADNLCVEYGFFDTNHEEMTPGGDPDPIFSPVPEEDKDLMCYEWNALLPVVKNYVWDEGYVRYVFEQTTTIYGDSGNVELGEYTGAPVIPTILHLGADGLSLSNAPYDFGTVTMN